MLLEFTTSANINWLFEFSGERGMKEGHGENICVGGGVWKTGIEKRGNFGEGVVKE